jgi:predicted 3-demethylubiquinone-9 3-methyltransferase (glyoxalase superfamily)
MWTAFIIFVILLWTVYTILLIKPPRKPPNPEFRLRIPLFSRNPTMQKITPFLWFNDQAEEAMNFYVSIFRNSKITTLRRYGKEGPGPEGSVMTGSFQLEGQEFMALNGGPHFSFTPAISLFVSCKTQEEVDELWDKLSAGGAPNQCGWVQDKFGLSWQIIPTALGEMLGDKNPAKAGAAMKADAEDAQDQHQGPERGLRQGLKKLHPFQFNHSRRDR